MSLVWSAFAGQTVFLGSLVILSKRSEWLAYAVAALGGGACIYVLASVQTMADFRLVIPPFGASCVLVFLLPDSPLAQPRNVIGGHLLSTLMGLLALTLLGSSALGEGVGVAAAILAMAITRTVHPPAGADPLVVFAAAAGWKFLFEPVFVGVVLIIALGTIYHRFVQKKAWPVSLWR